MTGPGTQGPHHVGYWVDDLDSALASWGRDLGVGPFQVLEHVSFDSFVLSAGGQRYHDVEFDHSAAFAAWGPIVVELGQVHAIDGRLAVAYGVAHGAISHVSWVVPDVERESARLSRLGCRLINTARSGVISVAWHDGGPLFPHPIELHQDNEVITGMHERLCAPCCAQPAAPGRRKRQAKARSATYSAGPSRRSGTRARGS